MSSPTQSELSADSLPASLFDIQAERARAEIDHAAAHVWAAIVDSYRCGAAVTVVDDGDHAAERQGRANATALLRRSVGRDRASDGAISTPVVSRQGSAVVSAATLIERRCAMFSQNGTPFRLL
jgi:hypothetical protein